MMRALALQPEFASLFNVTVCWAPFMLNPNTPEEGHDRVEYMEQKFGSARVAQMELLLNAAGREVNFPFNFCPRIPSTLRGHCLAEYVLEKYGAEKQNELMQGLFAAYFCHGQDVSKDDVLLKCIFAAGLDAEALAACDDGEYRYRIVGKDAEIKRKRIGGVPAFIFNDRYILSGAQPESVFAEMFRRIAGDSK